MSSITATGDRTARYCRPKKAVQMTLTMRLKKWFNSKFMKNMDGHRYLQE
jgi:uncharacterized membrane protein